MSIPAQGAVGAETMTAGQTMVLLPMDEPRRPLNDSGLPSVMIWAGGEAYDDLTMPGVAEKALDLDSCALAVGIYRAMTEAHAKEIATLTPPAALASPRADSGERTADDAPWPEQYARLADGYGPVEEWRDWTKQAGRDPLSPGALHALRGMVGEFATPAQPAGGVPDSLREALKPFADAAGRWDAPRCGVNRDAPWPDNTGIDGGEKYAPSITVGDLRKAREALALLASHPAGQSTGAGADGKVKGERPPNRPGSDKPCFFVGSTGYDAECKTCGQYTPDYERQDFECPWKGIPAPDSTRTGQAEAIARAAYVRICRHDSKEGWQHAGADFDRREEDGGCYVNALELALAIGSDAAEALAARPAAPEAQGAWSWTARDGHPIRNGEFGEQWLLTWSEGSATYDVACIDNDWPHGEPIKLLCVDAWKWIEASPGEPPAPPASSGQGGR